MSNFYTDNKDLKFHLNHSLMKKIVALRENNYAEKDHYDYAPLDFEDAIDSYDKVIEIVGEISGNIIEKNAMDVDHDGPKVVNNEVAFAAGTSENYEALKQAGLIGLSLPREYDGMNFPIVAFVMSNEVVARADASFSNIWGLQDCAETINEFASSEIKREFLPKFANEGATACMVLTEPDAGSDLQAVQLKATYDEKKGIWLLNGVKRFITNGDGDVALVLARSEEGTQDGRGLSLFVYDRKDQAVTIRRIENKMGIKGSPTAEMVFKNAPAKLVGDRKMGLIKYVMSLMNAARLGIGAQSVGISEAAYRQAVKYAKERTQFGKAIIEFPAVYELLANMKAKLRASRSLLYETSRFVDMYKSLNHVADHKIRPLTAEEKADQKNFKRMADAMTPMVKLFSSEYCNQLAYDNIQIHGGTGFMKDFAAERVYRDARITSIYEGTSQLQVVAAIKHVTTGVVSGLIREYEKQVTTPELEYLKRILMDRTDELDAAIKKVIDHKDNEYIDFHARRLVEMAGNIVMSYLLLLDTMRDADYKQSAEIFIKMACAQNKEKSSYINHFEVKDIGTFKASANL